MASIGRVVPERDFCIPGDMESTKVIVSEFCHLLEKSKQLFNGLRDLPMYGHKQWQTYFGRTFDVFTKLWKYQRNHRLILDKKYGLSRWQIGEIASKIGQLYYHYYLRTSDTDYLTEAFSFFSAIRERKYFFHIDKESRADQVVKKLRYYARFIIVCLLLKQMVAVRELIKEFSENIQEFTNTFLIEDRGDWHGVIDEIKNFIDADEFCTVISTDSTPLVITNRLTQFKCEDIDANVPQGLPARHLKLSEIIIVGNVFDQVRFSEITLDMFRMLQCVEMEIADRFGRAGPGLRAQKSLENGGTMDLPMTEPPYGEPKCKNPHKYLLYKPGYSLFTTYMAAAQKELPIDGVLLLYLSADGMKTSSKSHPDYLQYIGYEAGGVATNPARETASATRKLKNRLYIREPHCIYPGDLMGYTRRPFFLIVDSDNSSAFKSMQSLFGQPMMVLLSPDVQILPVLSRHVGLDNGGGGTTIEGNGDQRRHGSLFTLFLTNPLLGYLALCGRRSVTTRLWERAQGLVSAFLSECFHALLRSHHLDPTVIAFLYAGDFLRAFVLRFCFCEAVLRLHRDCRAYPASLPPLPTVELADNRRLQSLLTELAHLLDVKDAFTAPNNFSTKWTADNAVSVR